MYYPQKVNSKFDLNVFKIFYDDKIYLEVISKIEIVARIEEEEKEKE